MFIKRLATRCCPGAVLALVLVVYSRGWAGRVYQQRLLKARPNVIIVVPGHARPSSRQRGKRFGDQRRAAERIDYFVRKMSVSCERFRSLFFFTGEGKSHGRSLQTSAFLTAAQARATRHRYARAASKARLKIVYFQRCFACCNVVRAYVASYFRRCALPPDKPSCAACQPHRALRSVCRVAARPRRASRFANTGLHNGAGLALASLDVYCRLQGAEQRHPGPDADAAGAARLAGTWPHVSVANKERGCWECCNQWACKGFVLWAVLLC